MKWRPLIVLSIKDNKDNCSVASDAWLYLKERDEYDEGVNTEWDNYQEKLNQQDVLAGLFTFTSTPCCFQTAPAFFPHTCRRLLLPFYLSPICRKRKFLFIFLSLSNLHRYSPKVVKWKPIKGRGFHLRWNSFNLREKTDVSSHSQAEWRIYQDSFRNADCTNHLKKVKKNRNAILSLFCKSGELKNADATAQQQRPGALRLLMSLHRLPAPEGPRWNNQSLTGAGPASAPECRVPGTINRPG